MSTPDDHGKPFYFLEPLIKHLIIRVGPVMQPAVICLYRRCPALCRLEASRSPSALAPEYLARPTGPTMNANTVGDSRSHAYGSLRLYSCLVACFCAASEPNGLAPLYLRTDALTFLWPGSSDQSTHPTLQHSREGSLGEFRFAKNKSTPNLLSVAAINTSTARGRRSFDAGSVSGYDNMSGWVVLESSWKAENMIPELQWAVVFRQRTGLTKHVVVADRPSYQIMSMGLVPPACAVYGSSLLRGWRVLRHRDRPH